MRDVAGMAGWQWLFIVSPPSLRTLHNINSLAARGPRHHRYGYSLRIGVPRLAHRALIFMRHLALQCRREEDSAGAYGAIPRRLRCQQQEECQTQGCLAHCKLSSFPLGQSNEIDKPRQVKDLTVWPHLFISIMINNASGVYVLFAPSIVRSFGFEALRSNALASVGSWISLVMVIASGYVA